MIWQAVFVALGYGVASAWAAQMLIERIPSGQPLGGALRCGTCAAPLSWREQMPFLSWWAARGRCHSCGMGLGRRRAFVDAVCVLLSFGVLAQSLPGFTVVPWMLFIPIAVALAVIDMHEKRLPDALTLPAAGGALVLLGIDAGFHGIDGLWHALLGAFMLFTVYFLMNLLSRGGMGMGDVKLALSIGALTGYLGWIYTTGATMIGFLVGGLLSAVLLLSRRTERKDTIPFGPFMLFGAFAILPVAGLLAAFLGV